jgi:hypothetical protein
MPSYLDEINLIGRRKTQALDALKVSLKSALMRVAKTEDLTYFGSLQKEMRTLGYNYNSRIISFYIGRVEASTQGQ